MLFCILCSLLLCVFVLFSCLLFVVFMLFSVCCFLMPFYNNYVVLFFPFLFAPTSNAHFSLLNVDILYQSSNETVIIVVE